MAAWAATISSRDAVSPLGAVGGASGILHDEPAADTLVVGIRTLLVTSTPAAPTFVDGQPAGSAQGLKVDLRRASGELQIGDLSLRYFNAKTGLRLRAVEVGARNLTLDEWKQYFGAEVPYHQTCLNLPAQ